VPGKHTFFFCLFIVFILISHGCVQNHNSGLLDEPGATASKKVYRGKVVEKSDKTETVSIRVGNGDNTRVIRVYFDGRTRGIENIVPGKQVVVTCKVDKGHTVATSVKAEISGFVSGVTKISINEVKKLLSDGEEFTLIDARSYSEYQQNHLSTAISIPSCGMEKKMTLLPEKKKQLLVFYCGGATCGMSTTAAAIAVRAGYTNSRVMLAGIDGWAENGYPTYADDRLVNKGNRILIDLRTADKNKAERIAGSVSIPAASLAARIGTLSKKAPVIVYSDNNKESLAALAEFREAGFNKVSMVEGNIQGWKKRDNPVCSGPVITEINWTRKTLRGEVSPAAFTKAVNNRANALVLDVRTSEETTAGRLDGATLLPLNELYDRMEELPRDRAIYIYSATGARAEMAARLLKQRGYNVYFLVADISCQGGKCEMAF